MERVRAVLLGVLSVAILPFAAAAAAGPPQTREGVAAILLGQGFSSVTAIRHEGRSWTGKGVRNGTILEFAVDPSGKVVTRHPS